MLLNLTTLFRTGLISLLVAGVGLACLEDLASWACTLPDCLCRRVSVDDVDAFSALVRRRVLGGEGACSVDAGAPSLSSALVRALSFIGTGISSSELSSWNC